MVADNTPAASTPTVSVSNPAPTGAAPAPPAANIVTLAAGQAQSGVDVVVAPPASSTNPSVENLGVNPVSGLGQASNTGGAIHRGSTMRILLFGPGINSSMTVTIAGPLDINVSNIESVKATDNTPGIAFQAAVAGNAALGARTVYLRSSNGDLTAFAGGLEVIP